MEPHYDDLSETIELHPQELVVISATNSSFSVFQAEAVALLVGLRRAQDVGLPVEKVFSDSLSLVSALEGQTVYLNELGVIFSDIKVLLSSFPGASLSHVSRNFNVEAHRLAKHALRIDIELS
ncbi:hypothetical protein CsatA_022753 [Cannabis sativa]